MKRGVSFLLQNMTMLTDNYNLLRPVDKQRREKKRKNKARNIIFYRAQFQQRSLYFLLFTLFGRPLKTFLALRLPRARLTKRKQSLAGRLAAGHAWEIFRIKIEKFVRFFPLPGTFFALQRESQRGSSVRQKFLGLVSLNFFSSVPLYD